LDYERRTDSHLLRRVPRCRPRDRFGRDAARPPPCSPHLEGIVDVAGELDAAVIVIGSRGLSGLKEILDGSLSHQVAEHAGRSVLIVPPPRDGR
jgi:universal stress protein family protein